MSARLFALAALAAAAGWLSSAGCGWGDAGPPNPAPLPAPEPSSSGSTSSGGAAPPLPEAGAVKRTVSLRSPWGGPPGNLMVDGDFELSITWDFQFPQMGWLAFNSNGGQRYLRAETGGLCRTGVLCGVFEAQTLLFGKGVTAADSAMAASLWAKVPPERTCQVIRPMMILCDLSSGMGVMLNPTSPDPDEGWCHYQAAISKRDRAICMYIENDLSYPEVAIVDSATLVPATGTVPADPPQALPQAQAKRIAAIVEWERRRRRFGPPEQPPAPGDDRRGPGAEEPSPRWPLGLGSAPR